MVAVVVKVVLGVCVSVVGSCPAATFAQKPVYQDCRSTLSAGMVHSVTHTESGFVGNEVRNGDAQKH